MSRFQPDHEITYSKELAGLLIFFGIAAIVVPLAIAQASDPGKFFETLFSLGRLASYTIPTGVIFGGMGLAMWRSNKN